MSSGSTSAEEARKNIEKLEAMNNEEAATELVNFLKTGATSHTTPMKRALRALMNMNNIDPDLKVDALKNVFEQKQVALYELSLDYSNILSGIEVDKLLNEIADPTSGYPLEIQKKAAKIIETKEE